MGIPWWGWVIIAVVAMIGVYYVVAAVFFAKVSRSIFSRRNHLRSPTSDPFDAPFFKKDHFNHPFFK
jgi:hypothetical protein